MPDLTLATRCRALRAVLPPGGVPYRPLAPEPTADPRWRVVPELSAEDNLRALYAAGLSCRQIGERLDLTTWQVYRHLARLGVEMRAHSERARMHWRTRRRAKRPEDVALLGESAIRGPLLPPVGEAPRADEVQPGAESLGGESALTDEGADVGRVDAGLPRGVGDSQGVVVRHTQMVHPIPSRVNGSILPQGID